MIQIYGVCITQIYSVWPKFIVNETQTLGKFIGIFLSETPNL